MDLSPQGIARSAARLGAAAQNALEVARFGGLDTGEEPAPYTVTNDHRIYRLRHYFPDAANQSDRPPIIFVPPLMMAAEVYDVSPPTSAVAALSGLGLDPWVVDFGAPEHEAGGMDRTLEDHVLAVSDAVDQVRKETGRLDVHLAGYSQGGMFCYQAATYRRSEGIASLITFGSPVDTRSIIPFGIPEDLVIRAIGVLADNVLPRVNVPAWASRTGFRLLDPVKSLRQRFDFVRQLHDRDALLPRESQRRFLATQGWVAWPGPALADLMKQFVAQNRMLAGGFVIDGDLVTLADMTVPLLCFVGEVDEIASPASVRSVVRAAPRIEAYEKTLRAGHFGLVVGSGASEHTWPTVAEWVRWRETGGTGQRPASIHPIVVEEDGSGGIGSNGPRSGPSSGPSNVERVTAAIGLAAEVGTGVARAAAAASSRSSRAVREVVGEALEQLPRLARIEGASPSTRISLGLVLDEQAKRAPDDTFFLFEGRAHTYGAAKRRVDNIVRGLISVGVRQGEHIGVLMGTRPSSVAVVSALSRLGVVVVLMRPDGLIAREVELGQVERIIADPEHAATARQAAGVPVLVLGGGGEPRELGFGLTDMERIDPDRISLPAWYAPNPGRARDLAFILFTGQGNKTRLNRITNRRWGLSAFGTASAAALSRADTVYGLTPIHHPSGLLTSIGGAVAGGARLALATGSSPSTFWEEVRRYGVTIVPYTWTSAKDLVDAPHDPAERGHPIRLFVGSGMPPALWRRLQERFAPARVLEFYASTEGDAVLVNMSGAKVGAKGRPLPGSAAVRIAAYDVAAGRLREGTDGFAQACPSGEVGMLLSRLDHDRGGLLGTPLRGVFSKGDAWETTGDLFRRDGEGDYWLIDHVSNVIRTADGVVFPGVIEDALGALDAVDLVVAYGVPGAGGATILVAAVTERPGATLGAGDVARAVAPLDPMSRPGIVRVVPEVPLTTWYRPVKGPLRAAGIPPVSDGGAWYLHSAGGGYRALTVSVRKRLLGTENAPSALK